MTAEDLLPLPDTGKRYELVAGELIERVPPSPWCRGRAAAAEAR
jgi:hypothetical protein